MSTGIGPTQAPPYKGLRVIELGDQPGAECGRLPRKSAQR